MASYATRLKSLKAELSLQESKGAFFNILHPHKPDGEAQVCECEHISHFWEDSKLTPNGDIGHPHDLMFYRASMHAIECRRGVLVVCERCEADCFKDRHLGTV